MPKSPTTVDEFREAFADLNRCRRRDLCVGFWKSVEVTKRD